MKKCWSKHRQNGCNSLLFLYYNLEQWSRKSNIEWHSFINVFCFANCILNIWILFEMGPHFPESVSNICCFSLYCIMKNISLLAVILKLFWLLILIRSFCLIYMLWISLLSTDWHLWWRQQMLSKHVNVNKTLICW